MTARVEAILVSETAGGDMSRVAEAELIAGKGIVGDRYFFARGTFSDKLAASGDFELTLIEQEEVDAFNQLSDLNYGAEHFRRNIVKGGTINKAQSEITR